MADKILSIFVDESGDFGKYEPHSGHYIVGLVFESFDQVIIYYDNGQTTLTKIILSVFNSHFNDVQFRKVQPVDYLLFQIADLICTIELLADKADKKQFSNSEMEFFDNIRDYKKNYLKWIRRKQI